jgi:hypothetical protein
MLCVLLKIAHPLPSYWRNPTPIYLNFLFCPFVSLSFCLSLSLSLGDLSLRAIPLHLSREQDKEGEFHGSDSRERGGVVRVWGSAGCRSHRIVVLSSSLSSRFVLLCFVLSSSSLSSASVSILSSSSLCLCLSLTCLCLVFSLSCLCL